MKKVLFRLPARAQNYNAALKLRPTLVKVTNLDTILYR